VERPHDTARKLKVLLVSPMPPPDHGGIANWARIVCKQLRDDPDCELLVLNTAKLRRPHVEAWLVMRAISGTVRAASDIWRFCWRIWKQKPDVVHLCTSGGPATIKDIAILAISWLFQVPVVLHYHMGRLADIMAQAGEDWNLTCTAMALAAATVVLDKRSEGLLKAALPRQRIVRLPNPVEIDILDELRARIVPPRLGAKCAKLVYLGHVIRSKGLMELVEACVKLPRGTLALDIVGPVAATFERKLREIAEALDGGEWLQFCGPVEHDEAVRHIQHADLLVLPSYSEGMPNVVLEAMACGKAVLGTTVGALPEMLDIGGPQECGMCVLPRSADELSAAIKDLLSDDRRRRELGERGRRRAESLYAAPLACRQLVDLWKTVHESRALPAPVVNEAPPERLEVLLAAPMPPPYHGGIANWTRIIVGEFRTWPGVNVICVDTAVRHRAVTNPSLVLRLTGGSIQAIRDTYRLFRQMRTGRPDVLHLCTSGGPSVLKDWLILELAKILKVPSVIHYRMGRIPSKAARGGIAWRLTKRTMSLANTVIVLDGKSEACVKAALPKSCVVRLPNMVEIDAIDEIRTRYVGPRRPAAGPPRIVYVGQVLPTKGIHELVSACTRLPGGPPLLDIVGPISASFRRELQKVAKASDGGQWLRFFGTVDHVEAIVRILRSDLFALPSYSEGMPNVVLETMTCGKAILATPVGAVPEMLDIGGPEECGVCVPRKDVEALTAAIAELLSDEDRRRTLAEKARRRVERLYSVPVACAQLMNTWRLAARTGKPDADKRNDV